MLSAPLLMSNDLRQILPEMKEILQNRHVIEVDQDDLGVMGKQVIKEKNVEVWVKPVKSRDSRTSKCSLLAGSGHKKYSSFAVVFFNRNVLGSGQFVSLQPTRLTDGI